MGLVFRDGQWSLVKSETGGGVTGGAIGASVLRKSTSSVLTGSLLAPSGAVEQSKIFSAKGPGGTTGTASSRINVNSRVSNSLDLSDFSSGFTWVGWIKSDGNATNNSSTIFFSSEQNGDDAVIFRRSGTTDNVIFEYYNNTSARGKATTDSTPWTDNVWVHYGITFSDTRMLRIYKNGQAIQFDVNTDTGGSTASNVTSHQFNTAISNASRREFRMFGGDLKTDSNDGLTGEVFNIGFFDEALDEPEIAAIYNLPDIDFSSDSGDFQSSANLVFSCKFDQVAADGSSIALTNRGLTNRFFISGSSKPS